MKSKILFYGLTMMFFAGSASLTSIDGSKVSDALTVTSSTNGSESDQMLAIASAEDREEDYEAQESVAEAN